MDIDLGSGLRLTLQNLAPIPNDEWSWFASKLTVKQLPRGGLFCEEGLPTEDLGFVEKGLFRIKYKRENGASVTKEFCAEGAFIGAYSSMLAGRVASMTIEAIEDSTVIAATYSDLKSAYARHPCWQQFGRVIAERLYGEREVRERQLLVLTAAERLAVFRQAHKTILHRLSQADIASYLGINPVSLSRIRRLARRNRK